MSSVTFFLPRIRYIVSQEGEEGEVDTWREWSGGDTQGWPVGRERGEVGRWREQGIHAVGEGEGGGR